MAGTTGLEPATSAVTGQRSNQLSYVPKMLFNNLEIRHIKESSSLLSLSSILSFTATLFGPITMPSGHQTGHSKTHRDNKNESTRR